MESSDSGHSTSSNDSTSGEESEDDTDRHMSPEVDPPPRPRTQAATSTPPRPRTQAATGTPPRSRTQAATSTPPRPRTQAAASTSSRSPAVPALTIKELTADSKRRPPRPEGWLEYSVAVNRLPSNWRLGYFALENWATTAKGRQKSTLVQSMADRGRLACYRDAKPESRETPILEQSLVGLRVVYCEYLAPELGDRLEKKLRSRTGPWCSNWLDPLRSSGKVNGSGQIDKSDLMDILTEKAPPTVPKEKVSEVVKSLIKELDGDAKTSVHVMDPFGFEIWTRVDGRLSGIYFRCGHARVAEGWARTLRQWQYFHLCDVTIPKSLWSTKDVHKACSFFYAEKEAHIERLRRLCNGGQSKGRGKLDGLQLRKIVDCSDTEHVQSSLTKFLREISPQTDTAGEKNRNSDTCAILGFAKSLFDGASQDHVDSQFFEVGNLPPPIDIQVANTVDHESKTRYVLKTQVKTQAELCARTRWNWNSLWSWHERVIKVLFKQCERHSSLYEHLRKSPKFPATRSMGRETSKEARRDGLEGYFAEMGRWAAELRKEHGFDLYGIHHVSAFLLPTAGHTVPEVEVKARKFAWYNQDLEDYIGSDESDESDQDS